MGFAPTCRLIKLECCPLMPVVSPYPRVALRVDSLQSLTTGGKWRSAAMRSYRSPILLWFTKGQGRITCAGTTHGFGPNNAIFIPAGTMHGFEPTSQTFGSAIFFSEIGADSLPQRPLHLRIRTNQDQAELTALLETIKREIDANKPYSARALEHLSGLISVWLERQAKLLGTDSQTTTAAEKLAARFTAIIETQLLAGLSVSDYAETLNVTPTHLSRVCRATCGKSASELLQERQTFEARRLLVDTQLPINRIAELLGFRSPAYFSRAFKERAGETPSTFRETRRKVQ
jgi:AraC family transcriptional activator of pobA